MKNYAFLLIAFGSLYFAAAQDDRNITLTDFDVVKSGDPKMVIHEQFDDKTYMLFMEPIKGPGGYQYYIVEMQESKIVRTMDVPQDFIGADNYLKDRFHFVRDGLLIFSTDLTRLQGKEDYLFQKLSFTDMSSSDKVVFYTSNFVRRRDRANFVVNVSNDAEYFGIEVFPDYSGPTKDKNAIMMYNSALEQVWKVEDIGFAPAGKAAVVKETFVTNNGQMIGEFEIIDASQISTYYGSFYGERTLNFYYIGEDGAMVTQVDLEVPEKGLLVGEKILVDDESNVQVAGYYSASDDRNKVILDGVYYLNLTLSGDEMVVNQNFSNKFTSEVRANLDFKSNVQVLGFGKKDDMRGDDIKVKEILINSNKEVFICGDLSQVYDHQDIYISKMNSQSEETETSILDRSYNDSHGNSKIKFYLDASDNIVCLMPGAENELDMTALKKNGAEEVKAREAVMLKYVYADGKFTGTRFFDPKNFDDTTMDLRNMINKNNVITFFYYVGKGKFKIGTY